MTWADQHAARYGDYANAVIAGRTCLSSGEIHDRSSRLATGLLTAGVRPDDRVVLWLPNGPDLIVGFNATVRAGAAAVIVSDASPGPVLARVLEHCNPRALITSATLAGAAHDLVARQASIITGAGVADTHERQRFEDLIAFHPPLPTPVDRSPEHVAQIVYTSGSTGAPKGVVWTHGTVEARYREFADSRNPALPARRSLCVLPLAAAFGAQYLYLRLLQKMSLFVLERFAPESALAAIEEHQIEAAMLVAPMCEAMLAVPRVERYDLKSLRSLLVGGSAIPTSLVRRFREVLGVRLTTVYGLTELGPVSRTTPGGVTGSVGKARSGVRIRVVDGQRRERVAGQIGDVEIAAGQLFGSYYEPDGVQTMPDSGGDEWFRSGDVGYIGDGGELWIVGRSKELIIQGGVNVYPQPIVDALVELPGIADCAVVGAPDPYLGEEVVACVVRDSRVNLDVEQVLAHCRDHIDARQLPARVIFFEALPRNELGKIRIAELKAAVEAIKVSVIETTLWKQLQNSAGGARRAILVEAVETGLRSFLGRVSIDRLRPFRELGLDSMRAVQFVNWLATALGRQISATLTFNHPTVEAVCDFLTTELLGDRIAPTAKSTQMPLRRASKVETPPIAIIGAGCRLPGGADCPEDLWALLCAGRDATARIHRWDLSDIYDPQPGVRGKTCTDRAALLPDADQFDAEFFGLTGREAVRLDPQHRLALEVAWHAIEDAGYNPHDVSRWQTGVFLGISGSSYPGGDPIGSLPAIAPARIAHFLDLHGPALAIDTTCSSSLIAIETAVTQLRSGQCDLALAGGVNVICTPASFVGLSQIQALAGDGRCKAFDSSADGFGRGEGCVILLLKRLADAQMDHDRVLAVVRGCASNHDGRSSSLTAPNGRAQEAVIRRALSDADLSEQDVDYLEAHGTGTKLGDPIELEAAMRVFGGRSLPIAIGSIKTNIGHLEAAAGAAGVLKAAMIVQTGIIPPHLHFRAPHPGIAPFAGSFVIPTQCQRLEAPGHRLRTAGVTSMGMSGTNAHLVLEQAPVGLRHVGSQSDRHVLCLSARNRDALNELVELYARWLLDARDESVADLCFTASVGRQHFRERLAVTGGSRAELRERLLDAQRRSGHSRSAPTLGPVVFLFADHDADSGIGRDLYEAEPAFRDAIDVCAALVQSRLSVPLTDALFGERSRELRSDSRLAQPALVAIGYAFAQLWKALEIVPDIVAGCGSGEYLAAHVAGVFSLRDALDLAVDRGELMRNGGAPALRESESAAARIEFTRPSVALISAVTGRLAGEEIGKLEYWCRGLTEPLPLQPVCEVLSAAGARVFLQVSPGAALLDSVRGCMGRDGEHVWLASTRSTRGTRDEIMQTVAELYMAGADPAWKTLHEPGARNRVALPTYPFQRKRYWNGVNRRTTAARVVREQPIDDRSTIAHRAPSRTAGTPRCAERVRAELGRLVACTLGADQPPGDTANLIDAGIDSLRLMDLLAEIKRKLGVRIGPADFNRGPSIAALEIRVAEALRGTEPTSLSWASASAQLITIREGTRAPTLLCFHPAGGQATVYTVLRNALTDGCPIIAIQSRAVAGLDPEFGSIDEMAVSYAELIARVHDGPVRLFGWSLGGLIAHAVAGILENRGTVVELVGMVDPPEPGVALDGGALALTGIVYDNNRHPPRPARLIRALSGFAAIDRADQLAECEARGFLARGLLSPTEFRKAWDLYEAHGRLIAAHEPRQIRSPLCVWWARSRDSSRWATQTSGTFRDAVAGGTHYTVMRQPFLRAILRDLAFAISHDAEPSQCRP